LAGTGRKNRCLPVEIAIDKGGGILYSPTIDGEIFEPVETPSHPVMIPAKPGSPAEPLMPISKNVKACLSASSWIRKMFEEGARLRAAHGASNVFDFSLGNPNVPPPERFKKVLAEVSAGPGTGHGYMPNAGYPETRQAVADHVSMEQQADVSADGVLMTCGAAGGLNVILKAILDPGDIVVGLAPFFVEYRFYTENHGGCFRAVQTDATFDIDLEALEQAIDEKTRAVIINSPNNPTGAVYSAQTLEHLGALLSEKSRKHGRAIYLISDEPYRDIVYDGIVVPPLFPACENSMVVSSYSKTLSLPGERIGFVAVNPATACRQELVDAMTFANRVLGFVNAPALMQRVITFMQGQHVDIGEYARKRDLLCGLLADAGYDFIKPAGAFYLFPQSPLADDVAFVKILQEQRILAVPGVGFGRPGHFRLAFCVEDDTIKNAAPGFARAMAEARHAG